MDDQQKQPQNQRKIDASLSLGGLFKGLGELIDLVGGMVERGETQQSRTGEFSVPSTGEQLRGVYGVSIRTDIGGTPRVERFGNIRRTDDGPVVAPTREPLLDLMDEGDELLVVAELPGVDEAEVLVTLHGDILAIETTGARRYARELVLPVPVIADSLRRLYRNGILELRLAKS